jgi:hypothetical protein
MRDTERIHPYNAIFDEITRDITHAESFTLGAVPVWYEAIQVGNRAPFRSNCVLEVIFEPPHVQIHRQDGKRFQIGESAIGHDAVENLEYVISRDCLRYFVDQIDLELDSETRCWELADKNLAVSLESVETIKGFLNIVGAFALKRQQLDKIP